MKYGLNRYKSIKPYHCTLGRIDTMMFRGEMYDRHYESAPDAEKSPHHTHFVTGAVMRNCAIR